MASGMGMGPGPGQGSWPPVPQPPQNPGPQYPQPGQQYPGQQPGVGGQGRYSSGAAYPVAETFDGVNPDGTPRIVRPQLDPRELPALQAYLTQAPVVLAAPGNAQDELVPSAGAAIPRSFHSDGVWVWPAAVGYYLVRYQLPPSDPFLAHIRSRNYRLAFVPQETRTAVATELMAILNAPPSPPVPPTPLAPPVQAAVVPSVPLVPQAPPTLPVQAQLPAPPPPLALASASAESPVQSAALASAPVLAPAAPPLPQVSAESALSQADAPTTIAELAGPADSAGSSGPTMVFSAAEAMAQWSSLDSSLPQAAPPLVLSRFSTQLSAAGNKHAAWVSEQLEAFTSYMPTDDWSVDHATRRYTQSDRSFTVDGLGTLSPEGVWTWAWSEFGGWDKDSGILDQSRVLRSLAQQQGIDELSTGALDLTTVTDAEDPAAAAEMLAWTAMGLLGARGYIGHSSKNGGRIYYLVTDAMVPKAEVSLVTIPKHLFEGTATFGENAVECVIGYAEHHSWEWTRTADGIAVTAPGVGSFAAEIVDNQLVGLSLHV